MTVGRTSNSQNQLTTIDGVALSYDNNGNMLTDDSGHILVYDAWNRLVAVKDASGTILTTYSYDGLGHRITESPAGQTATQLYYSAQWQVIEERVNNSAQIQYVWSPVYVNAMVLRDYDYNANGTFQIYERTYALQDANFNTTAIVTYQSTLQGDADCSGFVDLTDLTILNANWQEHVVGGAVCGDFDHSGFVDLTDLTILTGTWQTGGGVQGWTVAERFVYDSGGPSITLNSDWTVSSHEYLAWNYKYQGGREDAITGFINFERRDYNPRTYTWNTQDQLIIDGLNRYDFVTNNPINYTDSTGLWSEAEAKAFFRGPAFDSVAATYRSLGASLRIAKEERAKYVSLIASKEQVVIDLWDNFKHYVSVTTNKDLIPFHFNNYIAERDAIRKDIKNDRAKVLELDKHIAELTPLYNAAQNNYRFFRFMQKYGSCSPEFLNQVHPVTQGDWWNKAWTEADKINKIWSVVQYANDLISHVSGYSIPDADVTGALKSYGPLKNAVINETINGALWHARNYINMGMINAPPIKDTAKEWREAVDDLGVPIP